MKKLLSVAAIAMFFVGIGVGRMWSVSVSEDIDFTDYFKTWRLIKTKHVDTEVKDMDLYYGSISGMVEALDDPHSTFLDPQTAELFTSSMAGEFSGVGIEVGMKDGSLTVISPISGSPASRAGLLAGDVITAVDGVDVSTLKFIEVIVRIRGEKGTPVKLTVFREGFEEPRDFTIVRDDIKTVSVKWEPVTEGGKTFMVITVTGFHQDTSQLFGQAAAEALLSGVDGLVLDLRNNPGGLLGAAINVSCFWASGVPIVIMEKRGEEPRPFSCDMTAILHDMPTVVLVNKFSASASEITAGALQDHGKARIIGEKTYGKGCGQDVYSYDDGSELHLTTFLWKTPSGRTIHKSGITPDEILEADPEDLAEGEDIQLDRAIRYLSEGR